MWLCTISFFRCFNPSIRRLLNLIKRYATRKLVSRHRILLYFFTLVLQVRLLESVVYDPFLYLVDAVFFHLFVFLLDEIGGPFEDVAGATDWNIWIFMKTRICRRLFGLTSLSFSTLFLFLVALLIFGVTL